MSISSRSPLSQTRFSPLESIFLVRTFNVTLNFDAHWDRSPKKTPDILKIIKFTKLKVKKNVI